VFPAIRFWGAFHRPDHRFQVKVTDPEVHRVRWCFPAAEPPHQDLECPTHPTLQLGEPFVDGHASFRLDRHHLVDGEIFRVEIPGVTLEGDTPER